MRRKRLELTALLSAQQRQRPVRSALKTRGIQFARGLTQPVFSIICTLPLCLLGFCYGTDDALRERLFREGPPAWRKWREQVSQLSGHAHFVRQSFQGGNPTGRELNQWYHFKRHGSLSVTILSRERDESSSAFAFVDGPRYSFHLERKSGSSPWIIRNLKSGPPVPEDTYFLTTSNIDGFLRASHTLNDLSLEDLLKHPGLSISEIKPSHVAARPTIRIEFEVPPDDNGTQFKQAWIELSPDDDWALMKAEFNRWGNALTSFSNEYRHGTDGGLLLYQCTERTLYPKENVEELRVYTFEDMEARSLPDSEFLLSSFGLPEPDRPAVNSGVALHYWFFSVAAVLMALALLLRWKATRI
jgi:hypothetical protein